MQHSKARKPQKKKARPAAIAETLYKIAALKGFINMARMTLKLAISMFDKWFEPESSDYSLAWGIIRANIKEAAETSHNSRYVAALSVLREFDTYIGMEYSVINVKRYCEQRLNAKK
jgi:hypothetical protein